MTSSPGDDPPSIHARTATTPKAYRWRQPDDDTSVQSASPTDVRLLFSVEVSSSSHSSQKGSSLSTSHHSVSLSASSLSITTVTNPYIGEDDLSSIDSPSPHSQGKPTISCCHGLPMALPPLGLDDEEDEEYLLGETSFPPKVLPRSNMHPSKKPELVPQKPNKHRTPQPPSNDNSMEGNHHTHNNHRASSSLVFNLNEELKQADEEFEFAKQKADESFEIAALPKEVPRRLSDKSLEKAAAAAQTVIPKKTPTKKPCNKKLVENANTTPVKAPTEIPPKSNDASFVSAQKTPSKSSPSNIAHETPQKYTTPLKTPSKSGRNTSFATAVSVYHTPRQHEDSFSGTFSQKTPSKHSRNSLLATPKHNESPQKIGAASKSKGGILTGNWLQDTPNKTSTKLIFLGEERNSLLDSSLETDWSSSRNNSRDESVEGKAFRTPLASNTTKPLLESPRSQLSEVVVENGTPVALRTDDQSLSTTNNSQSTTRVVRPRNKILGAFVTPEKEDDHSQSTTEAVRPRQNIHEAFVTPEKEMEVKPTANQTKHSRSKNGLNSRAQEKQHPLTDNDKHLTIIKKDEDVSSLHSSPDKADDNTMVTPRREDLARVFCDDMSDIVPMEDGFAEISFASDLDLGKAKRRSHKANDGRAVVDPEDGDDSVVSAELKDFMQTAEVIFQRSIEERNASFEDHDSAEQAEVDKDDDDSPLDDESINSLREELAVAERSFEVEETRMSVLSDEDTMQIDNVPYLGSSARRGKAIALPYPWCSPEKLLQTHNEVMPLLLKGPQPEESDTEKESIKAKKTSTRVEVTSNETEKKALPAPPVLQSKGPALGSIRGPDFDPISPEESAMLYKGSRIPRQRNRRLSMYLLNRIRAYYSFSSAVEAVSDGFCVDCASPTQKCRCALAPEDVLRRGIVKGSDTMHGPNAKFVVIKPLESTKKGRVRKRNKTVKYRTPETRTKSSFEGEGSRGDSIPAPAPSLEEINAIDHPSENRLTLHAASPSCQWSLQDKNSLVPQPPGSPPESPPRASKADDPAVAPGAKVVDSMKAKTLLKKKRKRKKLLRGIRKRLGRLRKRWKVAQRSAN